MMNDSRTILDMSDDIIIISNINIKLITIL
jgi:hypothetical protein